MRRVRRYRQGWLLVPALVASALAETGAALAYQALKPVPPPPPLTLTISVGGEGEGGVVASVIGDVKPLGHCTKAESPCHFDVPRDRYVSLTAVRGDKMTFEGWGGCEAYAEDELACELMAFTDRNVDLVFGKAPDTVEVAWLDDAIRPPELTPPQLPKKKDKIDAEKLEEEKEVQVALVKAPPPPPQILPPPPPPPPPPPTPPPPQQMPENMRAVEVDDDEHVVDKAPDDATMISDKNRDVTEQTRATDTNLDKESKGKVAASAKSDDTTSPDVGGPDDKIAHLEEAESDQEEVSRTSDHSGEDDQARGQIVGEEGHDGENGTGDRQPGLLAMRGIGGRGALLGDRIGDGKKEGDRGKPGLRTSLDFDAYERIIGKDKAEEERVLARARMGAKKGRYEQRLDAVKSALENFAPDIRPGNQTALKTRAHPFAIYLARMHRRIHERWGFGFLEELDRRPASDPLNDMDLVTVLELAVNPDGTLYKTTVVRTSGHTDFDVAAIDAVMSSAPYDPTPTEIRSVDQRVYLRWGFYRGPRQCGTFNAEPYILTSIPGGIVPLDAGNQADVASAQHGTVSTPGPTGDKAIDAPKPVSDDRHASYAANMWVAGLTSSSVQRLMRVSAVPFVAGGQTAATTTGDLQSLYEGLLGEIGTVKSWELTNPGDFTRKTGIPATVGDDRLVILVETTKEKLGVVLSPSPSGDYRATQLLR
ncbi:MAG TPA: cell envelope integrity protein TolA [Kofleriaceae bacterium]|nr:cell envelope integrity protein TolA [Kofleriaceae bacterium]